MISVRYKLWGMEKGKEESEKILSVRVFSTVTTI